VRPDTAAIPPWTVPMGLAAQVVFRGHAGLRIAEMLRRT
jgi:hypothetical protein